MDNKEIISQITEMMEQQTQGFKKYADEKFDENNRRIDEKLDENNRRIDKKFEEQTQGLIEYIDLKLDDHTKRIEIKIENEVTKKIEALFDGYKLTHEKQWELERKVDALAKAVGELQARIA